MKVIFAQGNPGTQYKNTRHNVGFLVVDSLASQHRADFIKKPKFHAEIAEVNIAGEKTLLVKPSTFYNETGQSARLITDFYKLSVKDDFLVIHDDLALPLGTLRVREKGSDAGNNGIKSLNAHLGANYSRIRVGIYNDLRDRVHDADFVLSGFTKAESDVLSSTITPKVIELIEAFCAGSLATTSHKLQLDAE
ncbi:MAG TPA: aminoacyl-tRNA hydrolase [Candidatus Saccharimonadales bacterium]